MIAATTGIQPRGFILLPVVLAIALIAAIAYLINSQSSAGANSLGKEMEVTEARQAANAGANHLLWQANRANCTAYGNLSNVPFGANRYSATITPTSGSPVNISALGTHPNGASYRIDRDRVKVYAADPAQLVLQPGSAGFDTYIEQDRPWDNFGNDDTLITNSRSNGNGPVNALLRFDLSSVPANLVITKSELSLYLKSSSGGPDNVQAHRALAPWTEGSANWRRRTTLTSWSTWGGDYDPQAAGVFVADTTGWKTMDITALVEQWRNGVTNDGLVLTSPPRSGNRQKKYASSDEYDRTLRPKLTISYLCDCGQSCVAAACVPKQMGDGFATLSYSGSSGANAWTNVWQESGEFDGYENGQLRAVSSARCASGNCMYIRGDSPTVMALSREANLAGSLYASLSFKFLRRISATPAGGTIKLDISSDGGASFSNLRTYPMNVTDSGPVSQSVDISSYISSNTQIRFTTDGSDFDHEIYIDDVAIAGNCSPSTFTSVTLDATADSWVRSSSGGNDNYGNASLLHTSLQSGDTQQAMVKFDVSAIPTNTFIQAATLRYKVDSVNSPSSNAKPVTAYALTEPWVEGAVTWFRRDATTNWMSPGGSYTATAPIALGAQESSGLSPLPGSFSSGWVTWNVRTVVQEWVDGVSVNNGIILIPTTTSGADDIAYDSREASAANRPQLVISY